MRNRLSRPRVRSGRRCDGANDDAGARKGARELVSFEFARKGDCGVRMTMVARARVPWATDDIVAKPLCGTNVTLDYRPRAPLQCATARANGDDDDAHDGSDDDGTDARDGARANARGACAKRRGR
jgi:hypothetical protein